MSINSNSCSQDCPLLGRSFERPRVCPVCGHEFRGNGWDGVDAHYRRKTDSHEQATGLSYTKWWELICADHKA